ncbi:hypothetical protein PInf_011110 [Phytophthora infestans]|nr:hypothetical protein PInf_011110 [Phytophthora infestans]
MTGDDRWETRALRLMYPAKTIAVESPNNDRVLAEVIAAEEEGDAFEDASPLPSADGTDDSDFYDAPHEKEVDDVLEAEEGSSDENAANGISVEENEGSDEDEEIGESIFEDLRFQGGFSRRIRSVPEGDIQAILEAIEKAVNLIPTDWERYGIMFKCIHGQEYKSRGKGKRKH